MNDIARLSKQTLIENIITHFHKNNDVISNDIINDAIKDINKISKQKLIEIIHDNSIPVYTEETLKNEIKETEKFTTYLEIIYHNYMTYHNIKYDVINEIKINPNLTSKDLKDIIDKNNLIIDNKFSKFKKNYLIDNIVIFYFKNGQIISNINRISKHKLIDIIIHNNIPIISKKQLKKEIAEKDLYISYLNIIYHNFMKYKNIDISIINDIRNNQNLTSQNLKKIIDKYHLINDNHYEIRKTNELIVELSAIYNNYCEASANSNAILEYKTIPDIIHCLEYLCKLL